jgi:hypothetical protein
LTQARKLLPTAAFVIVSSAALLVLAVVAGRTMGVTVGFLTDDPLRDRNPFTGALSNLGVVLWSATAGLCFLTGSVSQGKRTGSGPAAFFFWSGVFSVALMLDDLFQIHEIVGPEWLHLPQRGFFLAYMAITAAYLWWFRRILLQSDYLLLALAGGFFAVSIAVDLLPIMLPAVEIPEGAKELLEDGSKFVGIVLWLVFFSRTAAAYLVPAPRRA